jgi:hypothetical protein
LGNDGLKPVGYFHGVAGLPAVTPDGQRVAFVTESTVAFLDSAAGKIIGARRLPWAPAKPVLAFNPSGQLLACAGLGRVHLLDLKSGQSWDAMIADLKLEHVNLLPDFGWAGDQHLYFNGNLYDLFTPIPVWQYSWQKWAQPRGRSVWFIAQNAGEKAIALRPETLPHAAALSRIQGAKQKPGLFALRPGDAVRVDVSGLPAAKQEEVKATLERRVQELGYQPKATADTVFRAWEEKEGRLKHVTYHFGKSSRTFSYTERFAYLQIVKGGKKLWEAVGCDHPPLMITFAAGVVPKDHLSGLGGPDYKVYSDRPLPGMVHGDKKGGALGHSDLSATGIRDRR